MKNDMIFIIKAISESNKIKKISISSKFVFLSAIILLTFVIGFSITNIDNAMGQAAIQQQVSPVQQISPASTAQVGDTGSPPGTDNLNVTLGYTIQPVVWNLTAPTSVTFDKEGNMFVSQAGFPFTGIPDVPKIVKVDRQTGNVSTFIEGNLNAPVVDIAYHENTDQFFVAHRNKISTISMNGTVSDVVVGLPANGDHHVNQIGFSPDGQKIYFGVGSATNSGVVGGDDPVNVGWLKNLPMIHDIPGQNITLAGQNFVSSNPLTAEQNDSQTTGGFVPYGIPTREGQIIPGDVKCSGCILSANLDGTDLQLEAWGLRNPSGLAFNDEGRLFITMHGADERGSRMIANDEDKFYEILLNETRFYGWPDYFGNAEPVTDPKFQSERSNQTLQFLMRDHPPVVKPLALFEPDHTSAIQTEFADESFGFAGDAFVAQMGTFAPGTEPLPPVGEIVGQDIVRVNPNNGTVSEFITINVPSTFFRPVGVQFYNDQQPLGTDNSRNSTGSTSLYIVDWGRLIFPMGETTPNTGVVWKVTTQ